MTGRSTNSRVLLDDMAGYAATIARWVAKGHGPFSDPETGSQATIERQFEQFEEAANTLGLSFQKANPGNPLERRLRDPQRLLSPVPAGVRSREALEVRAGRASRNCTQAPAPGVPSPCDVAPPGMRSVPWGRALNGFLTHFR